MKAISQQTFGGPEVLEVIETDQPVPGPGEVLIEVHAVGVNPADWKRRAGMLRRFGEPPFTIGLDLAGTVASAGTRFQPGDRVFGAAQPPNGTYAEYAVIPEKALALIPPDLDDVHAAALPTAALTAWQPLVREAAVEAGQRVLIHAAAGGVGHLAVQIAKARGAYVIVTARPNKHDFLRGLGADELIDYTTTDFVAAARDLDVVLDPISEEYGLRSLETLAPHGVLLDVRGTGADRESVRAKAADRGLRYVEFRFTRSGADLAEVGRLVSSGALHVDVEQTFPLTEAAKAHALSETGRVRGKIVLTRP